MLHIYIWLVRLSSEDTAVSTQLNLVCECERGHYNYNISRRIQLGFSQYSKVKTDHFTCAVFREYLKGKHISTVLLSRKVSSRFAGYEMYSTSCACVFVSSAQPGRVVHWENLIFTSVNLKLLTLAS